MIDREMFLKLVEAIRHSGTITEGVLILAPILDELEARREEDNLGEGDPLLADIYEKVRRLTEATGAHLAALKENR
jgi:hypothetical protein